MNDFIFYNFNIILIFCNLGYYLKFYCTRSNITAKWSRFKDTTGVGMMDAALIETNGDFEMLLIGLTKGLAKAQKSGRIAEGLIGIKYSNNSAIEAIVKLTLLEEMKNFRI